MKWFERGPRKHVRKTTSDKLAPWLIAIFGVFFGVLAIAYGYTSLQQRLLLYRVRHTYVETTCTIMAKEVGTDVVTKSVRHFRGAHLHRGTKKTAVYVPHLRYRYAVDGREHIGAAVSPLTKPEADRALAEKVIAPYEVGKDYACWRDPGRPEQVFLERP